MMNDYIQKRRELLEEISESLKLPLIEKLPTDKVDDLRSQIKEFILHHKDYKTPKNIDLMLDTVFENMTCIAGGFPALGRISNIDINIDSQFYNKLDEAFVLSDNLNIASEGYSADQQKRIISQLCQYTLADFITIKIEDSLKDYASLFDQLDSSHFTLLYNGSSKQFIIDEIIKYYSEIYSSTFVENNLNLIKVHAYCKIIIPHFNNFIANH